MPYIKPENREELFPKINDLNVALENLGGKQGDLNYVISTLIDLYLIKNGVNYQNINNLIGVLECAKLELYRRVAAPYDDKKVKENGDVFFSV